MSHSSSTNLALVIGGGGAAGNAWAIGVVAGLAEAGVDLTETADLVIGTSSGATAAAHVRSGIPPAELFAAVVAAPARPGRPGQPPRQRPMEPVFDQLRAIGAAATTAEGLRRALGAFGLERDATFGPEETEKRRALVAARLPSQDWPDRPMIIMAVDAHTGDAAPLTRDCGVELADAVTASTAMPGLGPTHRANGKNYVNGGVRSSENADLAAGYATVVVLSPFGGWGDAPLPPGQFEGLRKMPGTDLKSQVAALREQGSRVEVLIPDADSRAAMGIDQMDPATRIPSARAGFEQGKREASRLKFE
ncbi:patatin-like phospholipase family protein [Amycolatopsis benzoatilytica]|uniref:patatin-like phospholipase family protein n=1 Tax=Amycolatopsis benzoatilytica TaxID=346045 RepID=UPI0003708BAA|nr:patatin-like phospholipase family protein [Amycolatopsis benzoatilytica]